MGAAGVISSYTNLCSHVTQFCPKAAMLTTGDTEALDYWGALGFSAACSARLLGALGFSAACSQ